MKYLSINELKIYISLIREGFNSKEVKWVKLNRWPGHHANLKSSLNQPSETTFVNSKLSIAVV